MNDLDIRLAAFDRKLREIEAGLGVQEVPESAPEPPAEVAPAPPEPKPPTPEPEPPREPSGRAGPLAQVLARARPGRALEASVVAGPFTDLTSLREFQQQLGALEQVEEAVLRGFEGAERAVFEVRLRPRPADG